MVKVLLTGMSGVGKSATLKKISNTDSITVDLDYEDWIYSDLSADDYKLDTNRVMDFIQTNPNKDIFFAGTTINQGEIYPYLDFVITLTAPLEIMKGRIDKRADSSFGKSEEEWKKIVSDKENFESLIVKSSNLAICTDKPMNDVVKEIYDFINVSGNV